MSGNPPPCKPRGPLQSRLRCISGVLLIESFKWHEKNSARICFAEISGAGTKYKMHAARGRAPILHLFSVVHMEAKTIEHGMTEKMIAEKDGAIGWMTFNQPEKHNAVSFEMWEAVSAILEDFAQDNDIRVVVLKGAGERAFISGADISQFEKNRSSEETTAIYNAATDKATKTLQNLEKPTIAMINGYCIGGGCSVAVSCDMRIASDFSTFAIPAAKLGLGYAYGGVKKLVDLVGPSYTKEIFYTARQFSVEEAKMMGLVNRVVPKDQLESYVREYAGTIGGNAPMTIRTLKATVAQAVTDPEQRDLAKIDRMIAECFASEDYKEGRNSFMEKRKAQFRNR